MDPGNQAVRTRAFRDIAVNSVKLAGAVCVLAFFLGGTQTRAWMLGFLAGTVSELIGASSHAEHAAANASQLPPLRLLGHGCRQEYGYQMCEGEVLNTSGERLENVMVEVRFQDKSGGFVKSEEALIAFQPLLPGQTSSFKLGTMKNPLIRHYSIAFKQMFGGELKAAR